MKELTPLLKKAKSDKGVIAVALFGSYARNEPYRDLDVCLFLTPQKYTKIELSQKRMDYMQDDETIDVQVFQQLPLYIQIRILKDAKILYCRDMDALYDIYFATLREYDHYKYIYEGYLEAVSYG